MRLHGLTLRDTVLRTFLLLSVLAPEMQEQVREKPVPYSPRIPNA